MIPQYMRQHEGDLKNFSLHFDYFSQWEGDKAKIKHHADAAGILIHSKNVLKMRHDQQQKILNRVSEQGGFVVELSVKLATPYVSGLGGCHPTETGMILDRNTGLPYIPASSIKGVLRLAHALDIAEQSPELKPNSDGEYEILDSEPTLRKYFGDTNTSAKDAVRGQLVFLDAFPKSVPTIKLDIMNPHFGKYYKGEAPPTETDNPIPVTFMSVKEETEFVFRVFASPLAEGASVSTVFDDEGREAVLAMFRRACTELGFGGKTSVGYGRFAAPSGSTETGVSASSILIQGISWSNAQLNFNPGGGGIVTAQCNGEKATMMLPSDAEKFIAPTILERLKGKKRSATGTVTVEPMGGNRFRIVKVEV